MTLPIATNTTCDIYRMGNAPPAAPDVAAVPCFLQAAYRAGQEASERDVGQTWTHIMLLELSVDIRDWYLGGGTTATSDKLYVPDQNGTPFNVVFVERVQRDTPYEHKRVYLDRQLPPWPTNQL